MVEMLGVLAIIGLLSIVGIAGYKKAMNRSHANELMDMAMKLWNENQAWYLSHPDATASNGSLCSNAIPETVAETSSSPWRTYCNRRNMGWKKPGWATLDSFGVRVNMVYSNTASSNTAYFLAFTGVGSCEICDELKPLLEKHAFSAYSYRVRNTATDARPHGLVATCLVGTNTDIKGDKCF